jgi:hypothetical protein
MNEHLNRLFTDAGKVELICINEHTTYRGVFDAPDLLLAAAAARPDCSIYTTINRPFDSVPVTNRLRRNGRGLRAEHFARRTSLFFDFDPIRPVKLNATYDEMMLAGGQAYRFIEFSDSLGWPAPIITNSGNGGHLVYRCDLPSTPELSVLLRDLYEGLAVNFTTNAVKFDTTVRNISRICRLPGFLNVKLTPTDGRPQRMARLVRMPDPMGCVTLRQLEFMADLVRQERPDPAPVPARSTRTGRKGDYRTLDVVAWFTAHGCYAGPAGSGKHNVICPWEHEHSTPSPRNHSDCVVWEAGVTATGWPSFHCCHDHCRGRNTRTVMGLWGDADDYCAADSAWRATPN